MGPVVLLILDGWGIAPPGKGNAVELAKKPNFDLLWKKYPHTQLKAHGLNVGLPKAYVGNSEAGHINIGAGHIVKDDAVEISEDILNGRFKKNLALNQTIELVKKNNSALHLMGMVSDGESPHSSLDHLYSLVDLAYSKGLRKMYLHLFTDGRDAPQFHALKIVDEVLKNVYGKAVIVSLIGRFYAMDRGKNWKRTKKAYDCMTIGKGSFFKDYRDAIVHAYNKKQTDEFLEPCVIGKDKKQTEKTRIKEKDGVIFLNARSDRARQLSKCFVQHDFNKMNKGAFRRSKVYKRLEFCALTDFGPDLDHILTAYPAAELDVTLPMILEDKKQLYIAETEKYAHVTYFMNGGSADPVNGETRIKIDSPRVKSYSVKPEMSVYKITNKVKQFIERKKFEFFTINFANPDMIGHTGNLKSLVKAIQHVDICIGELTKLVLKNKGVIIITADHGNAEKMIDLKTNEVWTGHTTNPVPFVLVSGEHRGVKLRKGILGDIAPTIYDLYNQKNISKKINKSLIK